jgi:hypothetical protein
MKCRTTAFCVVIGCLLSACGGGSSGSAAPGAPGLYGGLTSDGRQMAGFLLGDGRFWFGYASPDGLPIPPPFNALLHGSGAESGENFNSDLATQFDFVPPTIEDAALSVRIEPRQLLTGSLIVGGENVSLSLVYRDFPPRESIAGQYQIANLFGVGSGVTIEPMDVMAMINGAGSISGTLADGCRFSGVARSRSEPSIHDMSLQFENAGACARVGAVEGAAVVELSESSGRRFRSFLAFLTSADRSVGISLTGTAVE